MLSLVVSGGAARGIIQAGMLLAWRDLGLNEDLLFGISVGSLNGFLHHQKEYDRLKEIWLNIRTKDVYGLHYNPINYFTKSIYNSRPLHGLVKKYCSIIPKPGVPFYINTTSFTQGTSYALRLDELTLEEIPVYLAAAASPPVLFEPVSFRDQLLCDGALLNNFAIYSSVHLGADTIVLLWPNDRDIIIKTPRNLVDIITETIKIPEWEIYTREIKFVEKLNEIESLVPSLKKSKIITVTTPTVPEFALFDFDMKGQDREKLIQYGYDLAHSVLKKEFCL